MNAENPFTNPEELWNAIGRLYETTLKHDEQIEKLITALQQLVEVVSSHERRLGDIEEGSK
jgi:hypothetical protein